jgi:hypothetical protein
MAKVRPISENPAAHWIPVKQLCRVASVEISSRWHQEDRIVRPGWRDDLDPLGMAGEPRVLPGGIVVPGTSIHGELGDVVGGTDPSGRRRAVEGDADLCEVDPIDYDRSAPTRALVERTQGSDEEVKPLALGEWDTLEADIAEIVAARVDAVDRPSPEFD